MTEELSGVAVVTIIGGAVLICIILFIFAKRQIMRFALRSRRGPHVPIGHGAKKSLKKEIERRIEAIPRIAHEPRLMNEDSRYILAPGDQLPVHHYRFKAVDDIKILEDEIRVNSGLRRQPCESVRAFLVASLANCQGMKLVHRLCDMYEQARHDPSEFGDDEYRTYGRLLLKLCDAAKMLKNFNASARTSPSKTPAKKQASVHSLLEPSRLKPPNSLGVTLCSNKLNVSGLHNQYTTLQNVSLDSKVDDEIISVPIKTPTTVSIPGQKADNETTV